MTTNTTSTNSSVRYLIAGVLCAPLMSDVAFCEPQTTVPYINMNSPKAFEFINNDYTTYSYNKATLSNNVPVSSIMISNDMRDFEVIKGFASKILTDVTEIDEEIQRVINDHFWDMI